MADVISRRAFMAAAGLGAAGVTIAAVVASRQRPEPKVTGRIVARRYDAELPALDPTSEAWLEPDPVLVPVAPQQLAPPFLERVGVSELTVEALHNGRQLGFRLGWDDADLDDLDGIARFHDAVAIQLPATLGEQPPPVTMGAPGAPVHILQWRASWQRDIEGHRQTVVDIYPNAVTDVRPEDILPRDVAAGFYVGRTVDNPLSSLGRESTVESIVAEGFGTVTTLPDQPARGFGVHEGGRWQVAIALPLDRGEAGSAIEPGTVWPVAFAIWLGSEKNRAGRKHFADWIDLELEA